jgi:hypothetical protein
MTDVVRYQEPTPWVELLEPAHRLATAIAKTEFVPTALRNRPEAVMAAILAGNELGVSPMQALAKIHIVEGRPAPAAELMRAIAMARGHEIWIEEANTTRCTICGRRAGSEHVTKITWTLDDAKKARLADKQVWQRYPRAMLLARASAELCRIVFPDVLGGMSYAKEEVEDGFIEGEVLDGATEVTAAEPQPAAPATRTRQRTRKSASGRKAADAAPMEQPAAAPSTADLPPLPGEEDASAGQASPSMPNDQLIAMRAREAGIDDHHAIVEAATAGRHRSAKLTDPDDVAAVLDAITRIVAGSHVLERDAERRWVLREVDEYDRPLTGEERAEIRGELDRLAPEVRKQVADAVKGRVRKVDDDAFSYRHMLLVLDTIAALAGDDEPADGEVVNEPAGDDGEPF